MVNAAAAGCPLEGDGDRPGGRRGHCRQAGQRVSALSCGRPAPARRRNMNVNEVISNRAIQLLGGELGSKKPVHPERPRQHGAVAERHLPHGDAHRRRRRSSTTDLIPSVEALRRRRSR